MSERSSARRDRRDSQSRAARPLLAADREHARATRAGPRSAAQATRSQAGSGAGPRGTGRGGGDRARAPRQARRSAGAPVEPGAERREADEVARPDPARRPSPRGRRAAASPPSCFRSAGCCGRRCSSESPRCFWTASLMRRFAWCIRRSDRSASSDAVRGEDLADDLGHRRRGEPEDLAALDDRDRAVVGEHLGREVGKARRAAARHVELVPVAAVGVHPEAEEPPPVVRRRWPRGRRRRRRRRR